MEIDDTESVHHSDRTYRLRFTKPTVYVQLPLNPDTSIGCLLMLSQGIPVASKIDKEMMLREDPGSRTDRLARPP